MRWTTVCLAMFVSIIKSNPRSVTSSSSLKYTKVARMVEFSR